jgi:hypothetical protein
MTTPSITPSQIDLPDASANIAGNLYFGGHTDDSITGMRLFGGNVNGSIPGGFIDVRTTSDQEGLRIRVDAANGSTERVRITASGNVGIGTGTGTAEQRLTLGSGNVLLPDANAGTDGNLYLGGRTDAGETGLRLFGGDVNNGQARAGFIDVRTTDPDDGLRIRVDTQNGGTERVRIDARGTVSATSSIDFDATARLGNPNGSEGSALRAEAGGVRSTGAYVATTDQTLDKDSVGLHAFSAGDGPALYVDGRAAFPRTSGRLTVPANATQATQSAPVTSDSIVLATIQQNVAGVAVRAAVPAAAGGSFTVFLTQAAPTNITVGWFVLGTRLRGAP